MSSDLNFSNYKLKYSRLPLLVGLTGGIASGKSTVSSMLSARGFPVIDADKSYQWVLKNVKTLNKLLVERFGKEILNQNKTLNRAVLGRIVFDDPGALEDLNLITHPSIFRRIQEEVSEFAKQGLSIVFIEAPLLVETGFYLLMDFNIVVFAPTEIQMKRLRKREKISEEDCIRRIESQMLAERKIKIADFVIDNSGDLANLEGQIEALIAGLEKKVYTDN
jgi:dephospho-CoA kinase